MTGLAQLLRRDAHQLQGFAASVAWQKMYRSCAHQLEQWSDVPGRRIIIAATALPVFSAALWAIWQRGHCAILPANMQPETLRQLQASADAVITDRDDVVPNDFALPRWIVGLDSPSTDTKTAVLLPPSVCLVMYTSGSSGEPKAITRTLAQLDAEVSQLQKQFDAQLGDADIIATVPLQHIYGLIFRVLWPLCSGRQSSDEALMYPEALIAHIQTKAADEPVVLVSSPAHLERLAAHYPLRELASRLTAVFSSGAPLSRDAALTLQQQWQRAPIEVLGSTETGGVAWRQRDCDEDPAQRDVWQTFAAVRAGVDHDGLLMIESPAAMFSTPCAMGDRAELLSATQFRLLGRADRLIKLEGKRVSLTQMENCLRQYAEVIDVIVCLLPGARAHLGAVVVLNTNLQKMLLENGKRAVNDVLKQHLLQHFERVTLPRYFRYVERLPVDERGKTPLALVQALFTVNSDEIR